MNGPHDAVFVDEETIIIADTWNNILLQGETDTRKVYALFKEPVHVLESQYLHEDEYYRHFCSLHIIPDDPFDRIDPSFSFTSGFGDSANYRNAMPRNRSTEMDIATFTPDSELGYLTFREYFFPDNFRQKKLEKELRAIRKSHAQGLRSAMWAPGLLQ